MNMDLQFSSYVVEPMFIIVVSNDISLDTKGANHMNTLSRCSRGLVGSHGDQLRQVVETEAGGSRALASVAA